MPYVKAKDFKEYKNIKELNIKELLLIKQRAKWNCQVCKNTYYSIRDALYIDCGRYVCKNSIKSNVIKGLILTMHLIKRHCGEGENNNIKHNILKYIFYKNWKDDGNGGDIYQYEMPQLDCDDIYREWQWHNKLDRVMY